MKRLLIVCLLLLPVFLMAGGIPEDERARFEVVGNKAIMTGTIFTDTPATVKDLLENYPELDTIVLQFVPGSGDDVANLEAARLIREYGLNTHIPADGLVASGGTDFFCAGVKRTAEPGAEIGVHSWGGAGVKDASTLSTDHPEHQKYIDYYREMGIPEEFYWFTIQAAPASDIYIMTEEEIALYNLVN